MRRGGCGQAGRQAHSCTPVALGAGAGAAVALWEDVPAVQRNGFGWRGLPPRVWQALCVPTHQQGQVRQHALLQAAAQIGAMRNGDLFRMAFPIARRSIDAVEEIVSNLHSEKSPDVQTLQTSDFYKDVVDRLKYFVSF